MSNDKHVSARIALVGFAVLLIATMSFGRAGAREIQYRSFSASAAIGPPAQAFASKLQAVTSTVLGPMGEIHLIQLPGLPTHRTLGYCRCRRGGAGWGLALTPRTSRAGISTRRGDFSTTQVFRLAHPSTSFWGSSTERLSMGAARLALSLLRRFSRHVGGGSVALPIVGNLEQLSGYFRQPLDDVRGHRGIGAGGTVPAALDAALPAAW